MSSKKRPHQASLETLDSNKRVLLDSTDAAESLKPVDAIATIKNETRAVESITTHKLTLYLALDSSVQTEKTEGQYISSGGEALLQYLSRLYLDQLKHQQNIPHAPGSASDQGLLISHLIQNSDATNRLTRTTSLMNQGHPIEHFRNIHYYFPFYTKVNLCWTNQSTQYLITAECVADKSHKTAIANHRYELVVQFVPAISNESIRTLFNEAYEDMFQRVNQDKSNTDIYCYDEGGWFKQFSFKKRPLDTVYLPQSVKQDMIRSMDDFFKSKDYYATNHIPYKFVCLFWGLSGSGKTTLVQSLASHYDLNLAIIQFTRKMDDNAFMESLSDIPDDCMLLLEDIDSLGFGTTREQNVNETQLSLSCILNALDGVTRGRIDKMVHFDTIQSSEIIQMFKQLISPDKHNQVAEFLHRIRSLTSGLTAAALQKFFVDKRHCENLVNEIGYLKSILNEVAKERNPLIE